jgi:hypothetical protein
MAPNNQQQQVAATAAICLPEFYADSPQSWFDCLDSTFATANITQSITKFHWPMSKLPFSLMATVRPLSRDPTAVSDPYKELKVLLLRSYGLSDEQMNNKWLDHSRTYPSQASTPPPPHGITGHAWGLICVPLCPNGQPAKLNICTVLYWSSLCSDMLCMPPPHW